MKKRNINRIVMLFWVLLFSVDAFSQQLDSLQNYLKIAVNNNPTVMQRYNEYKAALEKVPQVVSLPDPQMEMGVFFSPMELIGGNQVADIKLMQMFPWFGVIKNAKDEMSLMAKAKYETFRDAKLQVCYDVQLAWYDLYRIRQEIKISQENVELLKTIERLTLVKFGSGSLGGATTVSRSETSTNSSSMGSSSGTTSLIDVYQIQIEAGNMEDNITSLRNEEQVVMARFNSQLNRPLKSLVYTPDLLPIEPLDITYLSVSDSMFTRNPMLVMLQYEQQSLEARVKMVKKMGLPMVGVGVNYSVIAKSPMSTSSMNGQDMVMPMLTVTLPIYRKKYNAQQAETNFLKAATEQNYQATANILQTDYHEALQLYNDAQRRIKLYDSQSQLAKKSLNIMIKTFSSSASGLTDIMRIRQQLFIYELKQVEAITDFNKAEVWVKRLTNNL